MKIILSPILALALLSSVGCAVVERGHALNEANPERYQAIDQNAHYFSYDRKDWVEGGGE